MSLPAAVSAVPVDTPSRFFKALGDETRLRIVALLSHGELCVCHLEALLGLSQPAVSRHLAVLRNGGVVGARREGAWVHYRLREQEDDRCRRQLEALRKSFSQDVSLQRAVSRLRRATGPGACR